MWLTGGAARGVLVVLLLGGACLAVPIDAAASDVCPTVMPAIALPDPSAAVEIDSGEPYAAIADRLALLASMMGDGSQVTGIRQIPESLPVDAAVAWVWQFGYVVDLRYPGDQIEQIPHGSRRSCASAPGCPSRLANPSRPPSRPWSRVR